LLRASLTTIFQWLYDIRLLSRVEDLGQHRFTDGDIPSVHVLIDSYHIRGHSLACRPRNTSKSDKIFLSEKVYYSMQASGCFEVMDETGTDDIWYNTVLNDSRGSMFALHAACINISCRVIEHRRFRTGKDEEQPVLATLHQLLSTRFLATHANADIDDPTVNDILNLSCSSSLYGPRSALALSKLEWWGGQYDV
jgi:hypothetical protein